MKRRIGYLLLVLAVPATVAIGVLRRGTPAKSGSMEDGRTPREREILRPDARLVEERERQEEAEERRRRSGSEEGDRGVVVPGPLAEFGDAGAKKIRLARLNWKPGARWQVDTWYLRMQNGAGATWTETPITWQFTVRGTERLDGKEVWVVDVSPTDLSGMPYDPGGTVYVSTEDQSVLAVRDRVQENGLIRDRYFKFEEGETSAVSSLLPVAIPPADSEGVERASVRGTPPPDPFKKDPAFEAPKTSGSVVDVEFEVEGVTIRQRWDSANGDWPLYSRTPASVSVLKTGP